MNLKVIQSFCIINRLFEGFPEKLRFSVSLSGWWNSKSCVRQIVWDGCQLNTWTGSLLRPRPQNLFAEKEFASNTCKQCFYFPYIFWETLRLRFLDLPCFFFDNILISNFLKIGDIPSGVIWVSGCGSPHFCPPRRAFVYISKKRDLLVNWSEIVGNSSELIWSVNWKVWRGTAPKQNDLITTLH